MARASREQIMQTLFALLSGTSAFVTKGRRLRDPEHVAQSQRPAFFLVEHQDLFQQDGPVKRLTQVMTSVAFIYTDVGDDENAIPASPMNDMVDALVAALRPEPTKGRQTLGGLVEGVWIDGEAPRASGDVTGKGIIAIPIHILLP